MNLSRNSFNPRSKHLSLLDVHSSSNLKVLNERVITKAKRRHSFCSIPHLMEIEYEPQVFHTSTTLYFMRLSKLAKIRLYLETFQDKICSFICQQFHSMQISIPTKDIIDTYDIIDG